MCIKTANSPIEYGSAKNSIFIGFLSQRNPFDSANALSYIVGNIFYVKQNTLTHIVICVMLYLDERWCSHGVFGN